MIQAGFAPGYRRTIAAVSGVQAGILLEWKPAGRGILLAAQAAWGMVFPFMTHAESRTITYAIVGSLAVHVVLALVFAVWIGVASFHRIMAAPKKEVEEPEVVLLFPDPPNLDAAAPPPLEPPPLPPPPPKESAPYIRTTQNTAVAEAPKDAVFESDRNTVAMTRGTSASTPDGPPMPSMEGVDRMTKELANRTFKDGETKDDSAPAAPLENPAPPPTPPKVAETPPAPAPKPEPIPPPPQVAAPTPPPPPPVAEVKPKEPEKKEEAPTPPPAPTPQMAKKEDSPAESMMKELDMKLAQEPPKPEPPKPEPEPPKTLPPPEPAKTLPPPEPAKTLPPPEPAKPPIMREEPEEVPIPKAIPVATPVVNTPKPQDNAFQPETHRGNTKGSISNVGEEDAVAAAATPIGRYQRQVNSIIEKRWHQLRLERVGAGEFGRLRLRFYISKSGKVEDLVILEDKASPLIADFTIQAILEADIPPLPADYVAIKERLEISYDIVIHPK